MKQLQGVYTALVTPFNAKGEVDQKGLRENIRYQIANGVDGIFPLGSTGESPTILEAERELIIRIAVEEAKGKVPVMIGTGTYSTQHTIENTLQAQRMGADMALIVSPYYNKPTQEGMYQHFKAISEAASIPVVLYNIQGRTGTNVSTETLKRIAALPGIIGVKESSANISQISDVIESVARFQTNFSVMSGDDGLTLPLMALGGQGIISVVSNVIPKQVKDMVTAMQKGDYKQAQDLHHQMMPLVRGMFIETNPIPVKAAMDHVGMAAGKCRLPLCELSAENANKLKALLKNVKM